MFEIVTTKRKSNLKWAFLIGASLVGLLVGGAWFVPLAKPATLAVRVQPPLPPRAPSSGEPKKKAVKIVLAHGDVAETRKPRLRFVPPVFTPRFVPTDIPEVIGDTPEDIGVIPGLTDVPGVPGGPPCSGCTGDGPGFFPPVSAPPPPAGESLAPKVEVAKKEAPTRVRIGGEVQAAKAISRPAPIYPPLAKAVRVQGTVRLQAVIGTDGSIKNLTLVSGHPQLVHAAMEAVRQWKYQPTLLNGEPVEVITVIEVNFTLTR